MYLDEVVAMVAAKTGWTLEYIYALPVRSLRALVTELAWQQQVERWQTAHNFALCLANWANASSKARRYKITDFIGEAPERKERQEVMMTTPTAPARMLRLADGQEYEFPALTLNIMIEVERKFAMPFAKLFSEGRAACLRYLCWVMLKGKYPDLTEDRVGELVTSGVLTKLAALVGEDLGSEGTNAS